MPELIVDGTTGFLVRDVDEAVAAVKKLDQVDPQACRDHAFKNFSLQRMIDEYIEAYNVVLHRVHR